MLYRMHLTFIAVTVAAASGLHLQPRSPPTRAFPAMTAFRNTDEPVMPRNGSFRTIWDLPWLAKFLSMWTNAVDAELGRQYALRDACAELNDAADLPAAAPAPSELSVGFAAAVEGLPSEADEALKEFVATEKAAEEKAVTASRGRGGTVTMMAAWEPAWERDEWAIVEGAEKDAVPLESIWGDPREGKPFGAADGDGKVGPMDKRPAGGVRGMEGGGVPVPRAISGFRTAAEATYIEECDEPWHFTSRGTTVLTKARLEEGVAAALPFVAPEDTLGDETRAAKSKEEVQAAVDKALAAGARKGSPALNAAEKVLKAADKSWEDAEKAKPKPPKK